MIELEINDYCESCPEFEVEQETLRIENFDTSVRGEHVLKCKHKQKCEAIGKYLGGVQE